MANSSLLYGSSSAEGFPILDRPDLGMTFNPAQAGSIQGNAIPAYVGDGDYFELPITQAGDLLYFNAAGSLQYTLTLAQLNAALAFWVGFFFKGDKLYIVSVETDINPDRFYLHSVDVSKTIVEIGSGEVVEFSNLPKWALLPSVNGSSNIQYDAFADDIVICVLIATTVPPVIFRMDITDGSITLAQSSIGPNNNTTTYVPWFSTDGTGTWYGERSARSLKCGAFTGLGASANLAGVDINLTSEMLNETGATMFPSGHKAVTYQNDSTGVDVIVAVHPTFATGGIGGPKFYDRVLFNDWVVRFFNFMGFTV